MAEEGLGARVRKAARYSSYAGEEGRAAAPNLLLVDAGRDLHDFSAGAPGEVLVTDITEFRLPDDPRKVYLSPAVALFDGDVAAFSVGTSPSKALVAGMPGDAVAATGGGFLLHSDRGWHYRTPDWVRACGEGPLARQRRVRGVLRQAQGGVLPRTRLARGLRRAVRRRAVRVDTLVPRGQAQAVRRRGREGVRYDSRPQEAAGAGRLGRPEKRPHPRGFTQSRFFCICR